MCFTYILVTSERVSSMVCAAIGTILAVFETHEHQE